MRFNLKVLKDKAMKSEGIQDLLIMGSAKGSSMIIGLAMQSVLAWMLGPASRGEFAICLIFTTITAAVFSLSLDWSTSYYIASKKIAASKVINTCILYVLVISLVLPALISPLIQSDLAFFQQAPYEALFASIYWSVSLLLFNILCGCLRGLRLFKLLGAITIVKLSLTLLATVYLLQTYQLGILAPILANLAANILIATLVTVYLLASGTWRIEPPEYKPMQQLASYGIRMFGGSIGMVINLQLITILLTLYVNNEEIGYFALAMALLTQIGTFSDVLNSVLLPRISSSKNGRAALVQNSAALTSSSVFTASVLLLMLAGSLIPVLFSNAFLPAIELLWVLAPGMWLRSTAKTLFSYFNGTNKPEIITANTTVSIIANIVFFFLLTPSLGLLGAAIASTLANAICFFHITLIFKSHTGLGTFNSLFPIVPIRYLYLKKQNTL